MEETRRHCSGGAEALPCHSRLFWGCFCNYFYLCDVFVLFFIFGICNHMWVYEKIIIKRDVCVFIVIYVRKSERQKNEFNVLIWYMVKYLKDK